jgi:hypothetical protein
MNKIIVILESLCSLLISKECHYFLKMKLPKCI